MKMDLSLSKKAAMGQEYIPKHIKMLLSQKKMLIIILNTVNEPPQYQV